MKDNPMTYPKQWMILITLLIVLVGCQAEDEPLPTIFDLQSTNEALAVEQTATAAAPTPTSLRPTLPPTFTPTAVVTETDTPIPTLDPNISPTPAGFSEDGTIYYNYNGDSIARVLPDGTLNEIIVTFGVDVPLTDLTASPNGELLAFVAPSAGSAREVWVSNRDGSYLQQVSCLGFGEVRKPTFAPDSNRIAFFAAPLATTNMMLYVADFAGSNDCPTGNNQQQLFDVSTIATGDITWNASGDMIYYNAGGTFVYDLATQASYIVSGDAGFGADFGLDYHIETNQVAYLRFVRDLTTGERGGSIVIVDEADDFRAEYIIDPIAVYAQSLQWFNDGESVVYTRPDEIVLLELPTNTSFTLQGGLDDPLVAFAPQSDDYVYTRIDPVNGVEQLYRANRLDPRETQQLTFNPEGTIHSVLWLEG